MDMSLVMSALAMQSANLQTNVDMQIMKNNNAAQKDAVQTLLGTGSPQANLGAGVGGQIDISA